MKILLRGYYGFKNLGDDILLISTYKLIRRYYPNGEIYVYTNSSTPEYLYRLLDKSISFINSKSHRHFHLTVHGGGGVHFDFTDGGTKYYYLNLMINKLGVCNFVELYKRYNKFLKRDYITTDIRVGIGIGIGGFHASSKKFYHNLLVLATYNHLFVRDYESYKIVKEFKFHYPIHVSTDLAFSSDSWMQDLPHRRSNISPRVGLILRDWEFDKNQHFKELYEACISLREKGYQIECYVFDQGSDLNFINFFSSAFNFTVWDPRNVDLTSFLKRLQQEDLVITSRAHGAIISACLGVPAICLEIEPKLAQVSKMLSSSSLLMPLNVRSTELVRTVQERFSKINELKNLVKEDVDFNNKIIVETERELWTTLQACVKPL